MDAHFRRLSPVVCAFLLFASPASAQTAPAPAVPPGGPPPTLTLQDAMARARTNSVQFQAAATEAATAHEAKVEARSALLPNLSYTTSYLYTQGNNVGTFRFIANNAVHEYVAQGDAHQALDLARVADFRRAQALEALARAKSEIAARGLAVTVVESYDGLIVAQRKFANTQQAMNEAQRFLEISQKLEKGGEVAHSDVIKAQLQFNDRRRDVQEAQLAMDKARLGLAVLLFPNFNQNFSIIDDLRLAPALPSFGQAQQMAQKQNPLLAAAAAAFQAARQETRSAWAGHLPAVSIDYFYGIDATHFAINGIDPFTGLPVRNLGYSAVASLSLPVWSWGATQSKVRVAEYQQRQAKLELSATQRELVANLQAFYAEAQTARSQLETLRNSADLAAESLRLTTLRYGAGEASVLEVVDAQNALTQARNNYDDGEARYRLALAVLQTLTGAF